MVKIACPWCEEVALLAFAEFTTAETSFSCAECGTSVTVVDEPAVPLESAA